MFLLFFLFLHTCEQQTPQQTISDPTKKSTQAQSGKGPAVPPEPISKWAQLALHQHGNPNRPAFIPLQLRRTFWEAQSALNFLRANWGIWSGCHGDGEGVEGVVRSQRHTIQVTILVQSKWNDYCEYCEASSSTNSSFSIRVNDRNVTASQEC